MEVFGPDFGVVSDAFARLEMASLSGLSAVIEQRPRLADGSGQGQGRRTGHEPAEDVKNKNSAEAGDEGDADLLPGERLETEILEQWNGDSMSGDEQQDQQPGSKQ